MYKYKEVTEVVVLLGQGGWDGVCVCVCVWGGGGCSEKGVQFSKSVVSGGCIIVNGKTSGVQVSFYRRWINVTTQGVIC